MDWFYEIHMAAKSDIRYQECLAKVTQLEPGFLELRSALPPDRQDLLDSYIAACEALDDALLAVALRMTGKESPPAQP